MEQNRQSRELALQRRKFKTLLSPRLKEGQDPWKGTLQGVEASGVVIDLGRLWLTGSESPQDFKTSVLTATLLNAAKVKWGGAADLGKGG